MFIDNVELNREEQRQRQSGNFFFRLTLLLSFVFFAVPKSANDHMHMVSFVCFVTLNFVRSKNFVLLDNRKNYLQINFRSK